MSRMNSRNRRINYAILMQRDGQRCANCAKLGDYGSLMIDHRDNDDNNNELSNLQLLCRSCNTKKNPRGKGKKHSPTRASVDDYDKPRPMSPEMAKSILAKGKLRKWVAKEVRKHGYLALEDAIDSGTEVADCSEVAAKKYLKSMTSRMGKYEIILTEEGERRIVKKQQPHPRSRSDGKTTPDNIISLPGG